MVIYADVLFLINMAVNYLALLCSAKICGVILKRLRFLLGAVTGAVYSVLVLLPRFEFLTSPFIKIAAGVLIALLAFGGMKKLFRMTLMFFTISALIGGMVLAVSLITGGAFTADSIFTPVTLRAMVIAFALSYAVMTLVFKRAAAKRKSVVEVGIKLDDKAVRVLAMEDTGNLLTEPMTGKQVMVAELSELLPLFAPETREILEKIKMRPASEIFEELANTGGRRFRLIPFTSVGTERSMLLAFRADKVSIRGKEQAQMFVAISPNQLGAEEYNAVINA